MVQLIIRSLGYPYPIRELQTSRKAFLLAENEQDEQDDEVLAVI